MFKLIKKRQPILEWSTTLVELLESKELHPQPARNFIPSWFKNAPKYYHGEDDFKFGTSKKCPSFIHFLSNGYIVPAWSDLSFRLTYENENKKLEYRTSWDKFTVDIHTDDQYISYLPENIRKKTHAVVKPISPWKLKISDGYSIYITHPYYHFNTEYTILPGIINPEYYHELNTPFTLNTSDKWITINAGSPLFMVVPFKRTVFTSEVVMETPEIEKRNKLSAFKYTKTFFNGYLKEAKKRNINFNSHE